MKPVCYILLFVLAIAANSARAFDQRHTLFNDLLADIVEQRGHQTAVDYRRLKSEPDRLQRYISQIESVNRAEFDDWTPDQQLAFLINVYNALTLKLILDHYPEISSIRDLGGLIFSSPWDRKFFRLFGEDTSLDHVEHDLIRGHFNEPRIHFAVNCASRGCPPLRKEAYTADRLEHQLEDAVRLFLTDPERNRFEPVTRTLELSSIFKWYRQDFVTAAGSVESFVAPYITDDPEARKLLQFGKAHGFQSVHVRYLDYDWSLNDIKNQ